MNGIAVSEKNPPPVPRLPPSQPQQRRTIARYSTSELLPSMIHKARFTNSQRNMNSVAFNSMTQATVLRQGDWGVVADFGRSSLPRRTSRLAATSHQTRWKEGPHGDVERMYVPWRFAFQRKSFPAGHHPSPQSIKKDQQKPENGDRCLHTPGRIGGSQV